MIETYKISLSDGRFSKKKIMDIIGATWMPLVAELKNTDLYPLVFEERFKKTIPISLGLQLMETLGEKAVIEYEGSQANPIVLELRLGKAKRCRIFKKINSFDSSFKAHAITKVSTEAYNAFFDFKQYISKDAILNFFKEYEPNIHFQFVLPENRINKIRVKQLAK